MQHHTLAVSLTAGRKPVFNYLADVSHLPEWADGFCKEVRPEGDGHKVVTPRGELWFDIEADPRTGVIDMRTSEDGRAWSTLPTRVVDQPDGGSLFVVTCFPEPGMSEEAFAAMCGSLAREMENVRRRFA